MADQIKELVEKIQQEGVQAAEEKARQIEHQAQAKAEAIVRTAEAQARQLLEESRRQIERNEQSSKAALQQAGRDMLLNVKSQIMAVLERVIRQEVAHSLSGEELAKIIAALVKDYCHQEHKNTLVAVNPDDKQKLEQLFSQKLTAELKKGLELKASDAVRAGFVISFDAGKSQFDFTEKALSEYIAQILNPRLAELLGGAAQG